MCTCVLHSSMVSKNIQCVHTRGKKQLFQRSLHTYTPLHPYECLYRNKKHAYIQKYIKRAHIRAHQRQQGFAHVNTYPPTNKHTYLFKGIINAMTYVLINGSRGTRKHIPTHKQAYILFIHNKRNDIRAQQRRHEDRDSTTAVSVVART